MKQEEKQKGSGASRIPAGGLQHSEKEIKQKAGFPGGDENAAGKDNEDKAGYDKIGAKPVSDESLGITDKKEKE